ncbi:hypothetical protein BHE90_003846 [Fusarium euwallaceae]|uniref:Uncharacterized protein n=4 Tax=Fusarium solani species complex TaxID=232080 RepID=A0A3M2SIJ9_9HYPO|nr:hypothetical protein CDV36_002970 [Fusarium kuroshium]RSL89448.1 hypothetical protein CEP51_001235 [Fusarium floridanum]RSM03944.1 hypothetical protein CEP52_007135 [Fusarium oligoseptatum]RTE81672.1 hypothetical protein BHE90_003846 [Fusarium euwallaceae]
MLVWIPPIKHMSSNRAIRQPPRTRRTQCALSAASVSVSILARPRPSAGARYDHATYACYLFLARPRPHRFFNFLGKRSS